MTTMTLSIIAHDYRRQFACEFLPIICYQPQCDLKGTLWA